MWRVNTNEDMKRSNIGVFGGWGGGKGTRAQRLTGDDGSDVVANGEESRGESRRGTEVGRRMEQ